MITLNLLSPEKKAALAARIIYAMIERLMITLVISSLCVTIALLFVKAQLTWNLSNTQSRQILTNEYAATNSDTKRLNAAAAKLDAIERAVTPVPPLIEDVASRTKAGIRIERFDYDVASKTLRLTGVADTRADLLAYQEALRGSPYVKKADLPISELFDKTDLHFTIQAEIDGEALKKTVEPKP